MEFVNERISDEDYEKYGMEEIDKHQVIGGTSSREWTICRENEVYIRLVAAGRFEFSNLSRWSLFIHGCVLFVSVRTIKVDLQDGNLFLHLEVVEVGGNTPMTETIESCLNVFQKAMVAHRYLGSRVKVNTKNVEIDVNLNGD